MMPQTSQAGSYEYKSPEAKQQILRKPQEEKKQTRVSRLT